MAWRAAGYVSVPEHRLSARFDVASMTSAAGMPGLARYATVNGRIIPRSKCGAPVLESGTKQIAK